MKRVMCFALGHRKVLTCGLSSGSSVCALNTKWMLPFFSPPLPALNLEHVYTANLCSSAFHALGKPRCPGY